MEGLDKFREAFKDFSDNYVIIGGTACLSNQLGYVFHDEHKTFNHGKYFNIE